VSVSAFGQTFAIDSALSSSHLWARVRAPTRAFSDVVTVSNAFGSDDSDNFLKVQTVAYVMGDASAGDLGTANVYKSMIDSYGDYTRHSAVLVLPYTAIGGALGDLSIFDVIVVGYDTGTGVTDWGGGGALGASRADKIRTSGAAVLGIGTGGAAYFQVVGLDIGIGACVWDYNDELFVVDPAASIFNQPVSVDIPPDGTLVLYEAFVGPIRLGVNDPPIGVDRYGAYQKDANQFPLVDQPANGAGAGNFSNFLWGFEGDPLDLTVVGHSVFANTVVFLFDDGIKDIVVGP
jgi:hypothetical protein